MEEDLNFLRVKKIIFFIFLSLLIISKSFSENFKLEKIISLNEPWGSSFVNKDEIIITEKSGRIKIINLKSKKINNIKHDLNFVEYGQGGLLDILYEKGYVWVSYTESRENWKTSTSIAKSKFNYNKLFFKNIFRAEPPIDSQYHFGSRLAIKDDYLYASVGERG